MKRILAIMMALVLAFGMALVPAPTPAMAAPTVIDFETGFAAGGSVEGLGTVHPDMEITSTGDPLVIVEEGNDAYLAYSANELSQNDTPNGGLDGNFGFGDVVRDENIGFYVTFNGNTVSSFSIDMFDYGDWFPHMANYSGAKIHTAKLVAYDEFDGVITSDILTFKSTGGSATGRTMTELNGVSVNRQLSSAGDALEADPGDPGVWSFTVTGTGIYKVAMEFEGNDSIDPGVAWDNISFELETYSICGFKYADWLDQLIPLPLWEIVLEKWDDGVSDWVEIARTETDADGKYCFTDLPAGTYRVSETLKDGWDQIYPDPEGLEGGAHIFVLPGGQTYAEEDIILYGTQRNNLGKNGLYEINLTTETATRLFDAKGSGNSPNGLGFDPENERLYYMKVTEPNGPSILYFHELGTATETAAELSLAQVVVGASFYDGAYYYIPNGTANLHKVTLNPDGTVDQDIVLWANFNGDNPAVYRFGDFAISRGGMLYASTNDTGGSTAEFFKLDVATGEYTLIADSTTPGAALLLQVSFGSDGTLYGHAAGDGDFFTIDLETGVKAFLGYVKSDLRDEELFSDLASAIQPKYYNFINTPELICEGETAWAADPHPGEQRFSNANNWATYVGYTRGDGTEDEPKAYPLYAGQHYLAGMLYVYNEGATLYVRYTIDIPEGILEHCLENGGKIYQAEGLCAGDWTGFLEYHLHVAEDEDGIPRTRTGRKRVLSNPIPGHFEYDGYFDPAEDETGWVLVDISGLDDDFVIAAHAVMQWCGYDCDALEEIEENLQP